MPELAWPWAILALPLPWLLRAVLPASSRGQTALAVDFLPELEALAGQSARLALPGWGRQFPAVLVWLLLVLAAMRPEWRGEPLPLPSTGRDLLLAVDVSGSMDQPDMQWDNQPVSRLELVQRLFGEFIEHRHGDRVGLILFGSQAYLQAPLTFDRRTVRTWLDDAVVGIAGGNTAIGDAIGLAIKRLRERPADSRVLVLITDGANNGGEIEPLLAARLAAEAGIRIHTVGIGAAPGDASPGEASPRAFGSAMELDEATLEAVARQTGGLYFRATSHATLDAVGDTLDRLEPAAQAPERTHRTLPLYPWPLGLAVLASFALAAARVSPRRYAWRRGARR